MINPFNIFKNNKIVKNEKGNSIVDILNLGNVKDTYIEALATAHAVDLIARRVAEVKFKVYRINKTTKKVEEKKDNVFYRLNLKPNPNELGTSFWYYLVVKLLSDGESLIIQKGKRKVKYLYIADEWKTDEEVLEYKKYKDIIIKIKSRDSENERKIIGPICGDEVISLKLNNSNINEAMEKFNKRMNSLAKIAYLAFQNSNINKWRLKHPGQLTLIDPETNKPMDYEDYKNKITEGLKVDEDETIAEKIILLSQQFELELLNKDKKNNIEDFDKISKQIGDKIANKFDIPLDIYYGTKTEKSKSDNDFMNDAVGPILNLIEEGINTTIVDEEDFLKGERIEYERVGYKHYDIIDIAGPIEKLRGSGFSFNDVMKILKMPEIDEEWANEHHMTKNFGKIEGGDEEDE